MSNFINHHSSWQKTALGTPIELYKKVHNNQRPLLFIGGVHGDEPEGVRLAQELLNWLQSPEAESAVQQSWILIPCLNKDGFQKNQRTNGNGVDLNRNFPSPDWSPDFSRGERYFPGNQPNSESETQCIVDLIENENPIAIIHFHSWHPCIVYTGSPGKKIAQILGEGNPYTVREEIGYPTPGSLGQYGWLAHQIPVICIEEQEHIQLDHVWPHFQTGLKKILCTKGPLL